MAVYSHWRATAVVYTIIGGQLLLFTVIGEQLLLFT
jgi:hypothetical protein